jgi:hypothetical protein
MPGRLYGECPGHAGLKPETGRPSRGRCWHRPSTTTYTNPSAAELALHAAEMALLADGAEDASHHPAIDGLPRAQSALAPLW